jgi:hypothetical protein
MVRKGARRRAGGRERASYGRLAAAFAMSLTLAGCASAQSTDPADCLTKIAMKATPATVRPGESRTIRQCAGGPAGG